jgi:dTDP-4-dehydrorhamnose 3,5-epimerase
MSAPYHPEAAQGARWDDPALGIEWPAEPVVISEKDSRWALLPTGGAAAGRPIG